jgi:Inner membrane protein YgaP-like, transmembrane domain
MKANMGVLDRIIRFIFAAGVGYLYFKGHIDGLAATILGVIAGIFLVTSFIGTCPLYLPFGLSTRKSKKSGADED